MANGKSAGDLSSKGLARHHDEAPPEGLALDATERLCSLVGFCKKRVIEYYAYVVSGLVLE